MLISVLRKSQGASRSKPEMSEASEVISEGESNIFFTKVLHHSSGTYRDQVNGPVGVAWCILCHKAETALPTLENFPH